MHETKVREEDVGHMLVEEGRGADKVECHSVGSVFVEGIISKGSGALKKREEGWDLLQEDGIGKELRLVRDGYIFIASNCSFLGIISSI